MRPGFSSRAPILGAALLALAAPATARAAPLYGGFFGNLDRIDGATGAATAIATGLGQANGMAYDPVTNRIYAARALASSSPLAWRAPATGAETAIGNIDNDWVVGLAFDAATSTLWGSSTITASLSEVFKIDVATAQSSALFSIARRAEGLAFGNGTLFGLDESGPVYSINPSGGATTLIATILSGGATGSAVTDLAGLGFDPDSGLLYATRLNGELYSVNPGSGAIVSIGSISPDSGRYDALTEGASSVPEPSSLAVLGVVAVALRRRR